MPGPTTTRSPTWSAGAAGFAIPAAPGPSASTSPAASHPGTMGSGNVWPGTPFRTHRSRWLSPTARTRILAWPGPGSGTSLSSMRRTSGPPCSRMTTARTLAPEVDPDALRLEVSLESLHPELAPEAALLHAAEREGRIVEVVRVHP